MDLVFHEMLGGWVHEDHAGKGGDSSSEGNDSGQEVEHELGLVLVVNLNKLFCEKQGKIQIPL